MLRLIIISTFCCVLVSALKTGLTRREKWILKKQHNMYRSQDASQGSQSASNLMKLRWNRKLAKRAQTTANKCLFEHSNLAGTGIGENLFISTGDVTKKKVGKAVDAWYKEKQYYHISTNKCDAKKVCGHYKQVLWAPTSKVGCGLRQCANVVFAKKRRTVTIVVCNYDKIVMRKQKLFIVGPSCSNCPAKFQRCSKDTGNLCRRGTNGKRGLEDILDSLMERDSSDEFGSEEESEEELRRSVMTEDDEEEEEEEMLL